MAVPGFFQCLIVPHGMVCRISGDSDTGSVCDTYRRQPFPEPSQPTFVDQCVICGGYYYLAAIYSPRSRAGIYSAAAIVIRGDYVTIGNLPFACSSCEDLVLSPACLALTRRIGLPRHGQAWRPAGEVSP